MVSDNGSVSRTQVSPSTTAGTRRWWVIGGGLVTLFTAAIVGLGIYLNTGKVHVDVVGYAVVDGRTATVTFEVYRPADTAVVCRARAIAFDFSVVGTKDVTIPAEADDGSRTVRQEATVRTTTRANTATIANCVVEGARSE